MKKLPLLENKNKDIIITIPKSTSWETYQQEIDKVKDGKYVMNYEVTNFPKYTSIGNKCYVVYDGYIRGYMYISGMSEDDFECEITKKKFKGKFIQRSGKFYETRPPIKCDGFRGFRYFDMDEFTNN